MDLEEKRKEEKETVRERERERDRERKRERDRERAVCSGSREGERVTEPASPRVSHDLSVT